MTKPKSNYFIDTARDLLHRLDLCPVLAYVTNAGKGKSSVISELSKEFDLSTDDGYRPRMIFSTNSRVNRDAFHKNNKHFYRVFGNYELIKQIAGVQASNEYNAYFNGGLTVSKPMKGVKITTKEILEDMFSRGTVTKDEQCKIQSRIIEQIRQANKAQFVVCTNAKMQTGQFFEIAYGRYVFMDEMNDSKLFRAELKDFDMWKGNVTCDVDESTQVNQFTQRLFDCTLGSVQSGAILEPSILGVCLLSAEESLTAAVNNGAINHDFDKTLSGKIDGNKNFESPQKITDENLEVYIVKSTSNNNLQSNRDLLVRVLRTAFPTYEVICDGKIQIQGDPRLGQAIGDHTIEGCKGSNDLRNTDLITVVGYPSPQEIADKIAGCFIEIKANEIYEFCGIQQSKDQCIEIALKLIVNDKINQAVGRNTGYRSNGRKHLLFIPSKLNEYFNPHTEGVIYPASSKKDLKLLPEGVREALNELYDSPIYRCIELMRDYRSVLFNDPSMAFSSKLIKDKVRQFLVASGFSEHELHKDGLVAKCLDLLNLTRFKRGTKADRGWYYHLAEVQSVDVVNFVNR